MHRKRVYANLDVAEAEQWRRAFWLEPRWSATLSIGLCFLFSQGPRGPGQADGCVVRQAVRNPGGGVRFACLVA